MNEHQAIATQAYLLWEREGCPDGKALDHWLAAERQWLGAADRPANPTPSKTKRKPAASKPKARRKPSAKQA